MGELIIFRARVGEDIDIRSGQGDLQGNLNGTDAHLRTVSSSLRGKRQPSKTSL